MSKPHGKYAAMWKTQQALESEPNSDLLTPDDDLPQTMKNITKNNSSSSNTNGNDSNNVPQ